MFDNIDRTELSTLGEFGLIEHLTKNIEIYNPENTILGVGDDCAVASFKEKQTLITTDIMVEGVHFDLTYTPLKHLGYKAAISNFSDIYSMNGTPKQIVIGMAISNRFSLEAVEEFYSGVLLACKKYQVDLVGGDTTSSQKGMFISITAIGEAETEKITYRKGAKSGDLLCVTGDLGGAYMGLHILEREKRAFLAAPGIQPELEGKDYILERILKPEARKDIIEYFEKNDIVPTSMIDISDGLASEILHICKSSEVGCDLYEEKIPIDPMTYNTAREFDLDPTVCAFSGGEDYELLFTIKQSDYEKVKNDPNITIIGHITEKGSKARMISKSGTTHDIVAQGWDHMKRG